MSRPEARSKALTQAFLSRVKADIRDRRTALGLTQAAVAKAADMMQPVVSRLESPGYTAMNLGTLQRIAAALNCVVKVELVDMASAAKELDDDPEEG